MHMCVMKGTKWWWIVWRYERRNGDLFVLSWAKVQVTLSQSSMRLFDLVQMWMLCRHACMCLFCLYSNFIWCRLHRLWVVLWLGGVDMSQVYMLKSSGERMPLWGVPVWVWCVDVVFLKVCKLCVLDVVCNDPSNLWNVVWNVVVECCIYAMLHGSKVYSSVLSNVKRN